jgi:hypothetical protein
MLDVGGAVSPAAYAPNRSDGYAVIQNDLGHLSTSALEFDASGKHNVEGIVDFGHCVRTQPRRSDVRSSLCGPHVTAASLRSLLARGYDNNHGRTAICFSPVIENYTAETARRARRSPLRIGARYSTGTFLKNGLPKSSRRSS